MAAPAPTGIIIVAGEQADGTTYQLHPLSRARIEARFPGTRLLRSLFVGLDTQTDYTDMHGPMWEQIVLLLTGLTLARVHELGDVVIRFPASGREVAVPLDLHLDTPAAG